MGRYQEAVASSKESLWRMETLFHTHGPGIHGAQVTLEVPKKEGDWDIMIGILTSTFSIGSLILSLPSWISLLSVSIAVATIGHAIIRYFKLKKT